MENIKYIIIFGYSDDGLYINISYNLCKSLDDVENSITRLKSKYEIKWLKVFPMSSELTQYGIDNGVKSSVL